jgi:hypothetical protein
VEILREERAHLARIEQSALSAHGTEAAVAAFVILGIIGLLLIGIRAL